MSNLDAFLDMISYAEGTYGKGEEGYNVLVGGGLFHTYADHPFRNKPAIQLNPHLASTAAGRYQLLFRYFDPYKAMLHLPDFGPEAQDEIAIQQIQERHAYSDVLFGRFESAIDKVNATWASLPAAGYGQCERDLASLKLFFIQRGGILIPDQPMVAYDGRHNQTDPCFNADLPSDLHGEDSDETE